MIKIIRANYLHDTMIRLTFSDGMVGDYDLRPLLDCDTVMVKPLQEPAFFQDFFLELGALCWKNGFELSPGSIYHKLENLGLLKQQDKVA